MARTRMTWGEGRSASAPPAVPGYGTEDQDHPAHQDDPDYTDYKKGDPDAWAETPKAPPYSQGGPPATPGYGTEDQDHPAHKNPPLAKEAQLRVAIERKAKKCIRIARVLLGSKATEASVEDQALDMMDWSDTALDSTLGRLGGGFLAEGPSVEDRTGCGPMAAKADDDDLDSMMAEMEKEDPKGQPAAPVMAQLLDKLASLTAEIRSLRADQNDPKGDTLAPKPETEEQVKAEAKGTEKGEAKTAKTARTLFASMDTDGDGFITLEDWKGSRSLFASMDTDGDGIIAMDEMVAVAVPQPQQSLIAGLDPEETALLAEMEARMASDDNDEDDEEEEEEEEEKEAGKKAGEVPEAFKKQWAKNKGDKEEEEEEEDPKKAGKKAKKAEDEEIELEEKEEEAPKESASQKKKAKKAEEVEEEEEDEEDAEGKAGKKAGCMDDGMSFEMHDDPMGLGDNSNMILDKNDDAILAEIFGGKVAEDAEGKEEEEAEEETEGEESEGEEEDKKEEEVASKKASVRTAALHQRPQPRKPSQGVRQVGQVSRTASSNDELADLTRLWQSAPDVSSVFGGGSQD